MGMCTRCGANAGFLMSVCEDCLRATEEERRSTHGESAQPRGERGIDQLVFVGLNGYALALDRDTGEIVWSNNELKSGYVSMLLDGDRLIVSTNGYIYCLHPLTGRVLWNNPLRGYGMGAPTHLVSVRGQSSQTLIEQAAAVEAANRAPHANHGAAGS